METVLKEELISLSQLISRYGVLVHNDDVNTFEYVIACFIRVCGLSFSKATEMTFKIHNEGKAIVKEGEEETISKMVKQLCQLGINAEMVPLI